MSHKDKGEYDKDKHDKGKVVLCGTVARNIKRTTMKGIKESESDIASACSIFHKKHEQKTGKPILTMGEFVKVTEEFSKLPISEVEKLIKEGKEEDIRRQKALSAMRKSRIS